MDNREVLICNLDKLHTTEMGIDRIRKNLCLDIADVVAWCRERIKDDSNSIICQGKNWYIETNNYRITVNAHSYTIITAHKLK